MFTMSIFYESRFHSVCLLLKSLQQEKTTLFARFTKFYLKRKAGSCIQISWTVNIELINVTYRETAKLISFGIRC